VKEAEVSIKNIYKKYLEDEAGLKELAVPIIKT